MPLGAPTLPPPRSPRPRPPSPRPRPFPRLPRPWSARHFEPEGAGRKLVSSLPFHLWTVFEEIGARPCLCVVAHSNGNGNGQYSARWKGAGWEGQGPTGQQVGEKGQGEGRGEWCKGKERLEGQDWADRGTERIGQAQRHKTGMGGASSLRSSVFAWGGERAWLTCKLWLECAGKAGVL